MPTVEMPPVIAPLLVTVSPPVPNNSMPVPPAARLMVPPFPFVNVLALTPKKAVPATPTVMSPLLVTLLLLPTSIAVAVAPARISLLLVTVLRLPARMPKMPCVVIVPLLVTVLRLLTSIEATPLSRTMALGRTRTSRFWTPAPAVKPS